MSETLEQVRALVARGDVRVSLHGYEELAADNIRVHEIIDGLATATLIEDYPTTPRVHASWFCSKMTPISRFM